LKFLVEYFSNDSEKKFACYCKALSLKTSETSLVKFRLSFASLLIEKELFSEAKTEIEKLVSVRLAQGWKIPDQVKQWQEQDWYITAKSKSDNSLLYKKHLKLAEDILFQDIPEEVVVVEFVNTNKHILNFVKDKTKHGFFKYSGYLENPKVGEILKVRFNGEGQNGFFKIFSVRKETKNTESPAIRKFEGNLKLIAPQNFGFVDDVFIDAKTVKANNLIDGQDLKGMAILSYNKKKKEWGWKAISIQ